MVIPDFREIQHSAKGTTWKNHKYVSKEGNRYIYSNVESGKFAMIGSSAAEKASQANDLAKMSEERLQGLVKLTEERARGVVHITLGDWKSGKYEWNSKEGTFVKKNKK